MFASNFWIYPVFIGLTCGQNKLGLPHLGDPSSSKPCVVPNPPQNGNYSLFSLSCINSPVDGSSCWTPPGESVPHLQILSIFCNSGYQLREQSVSTVVSLCNNGVWSLATPECQQLCSPLVSLSVDVSCTFQGNTVSCSEFMLPGTTARLKCKKYFTLNNRFQPSTLLCQENGEWNGELLKCDPPECGLDTREEIQRLRRDVSTSDQTEREGAYPWTAIIFLRDETQGWRHGCLGTLITPHIVLTAAHCVQTKYTNITDLKVGLGKTNRYYNTTESNSVIVEVNSIVNPEEFTGSATFYAYDFALLNLSSVVDLSANIIPACTDWSDDVTIENGTLGYVSGFSAGDSDVFHTGQMPYIDNKSCIKMVRANYQRLVTFDKFCTSVYNESNPIVGRGDSGVGFTTKQNGKHFVAGVLSTSVNPNSDIYVLGYTNINNLIHKKWLKDQKDRLERSRRQTVDQNCLDISENGECVDEGNDSSSTTKPTPIPTPRDTCKVPDPSGYRVFSLYTCVGDSATCSKSPGDSVPDAELILITCIPGYYLVQGVNTFTSKSLTVCQNGQWDPILPSCIKLCPPLTSLTVDLHCWQGPNIVDCNQPMLPGTTVEYSCKEYHYDGGNVHTRIKCNPTGEWSKELPYCTPNCGMSNLDSFEISPTIIGGNISKPGNFPWHGGIYHNTAKGWEAKCGGTLIGTRFLLTAAHCVTVACPICKPPPMPKEKIMVSLGRNYRQWNVKEDSEIRRSITDIRVHPDYVGSALNFGNDIAILVLDSEVPVTSYVMPACLDTKQKYINQLIENKAMEGYVAGWGNTEECTAHGSICNTPSDELKYTRTTILNFTECFNVTQTIKAFQISRLSTDKYCAGNGSESVVQQGDSGGGLTFNFKGLHYIYGVVSVKLKMGLEDKFYYSFGAFTSVSHHLSWLKTQIY